MAHACFIVADLDRSLHFYQDALGLPLAFDFKNEQASRRGVYLHLGGRTFIELFLGEVAEPAKAQSFRHICLEVDDIVGMLAQLKEKGIQLIMKNRAPAPMASAMPLFTLRVPME